MRFNKDIKKIFNENRDSAVIGVIMALVLIATAFAIGESVASVPAAQAGTDESDDTLTQDGRENLKFQMPKSLLKDITADDDEEEFTPGPDKLNMAYYYSEDADTEDAINSYAGQVFQELTALNASYLASFYDLTDTTPLRMAGEMGLDSSRVMGKFNPEDPSHDPSNPSTWTINSFKNVSVNFYDGDGNRINGYYAAQEIMSLASVYMYFHDDYDPEHFEDYCRQLFESAVTSRVSMGSPYYCSGCLNRTAQQELQEALAIENERLSLENKLAGQTALSSGNEAMASVYASAEQSSTIENIIDVNQYRPDIPTQTESQAAEASPAETTSLDAETLNSAVVSNVQETTAEPSSSAALETSAASGGTEAPPVIPEQQTSAETESPSPEAAPQPEAPSSAAAEPSIEEIIDPNSFVPAIGGAEDAAMEAVPAEAAVQSETPEIIPYSEPATAAAEASQPVESSEIAVISSSLENIAQGSEASEAASETAEESSYAVYNSSIVQESKVSVDAYGNVIYNDTGTVQPAAGSAGIVPETTAETESAALESSVSAQESEAIEQAEVNERINALLQQADIHASAESYCPGHIDIYVTVTIRGIDDRNGLFAADRIGNDESNFTDKWQGWTEEMMEYARALNAQDWLDNYGLSISSINLNNPLTPEEIDNYIATLPADIDPLRKDIIEFALNSVGKVPYYWGGKPSGGGYEVNNFSTLIAPDTRGRILKGLDCSGWINWVYWSVTGSSLPGESTGTLVGCGRKISRSELKAGDIIIRVGGDAHVVMFLCWAEDGDFYAIHETGGVINNVTVSKMTANWPYYRSLIN